MHFLSVALKKLSEVSRKKWHFGVEKVYILLKFCTDLMPKIATASNSRFAQLRILFKPVVYFPLENLILVENMRTRSSQLTRSAGTLCVRFQHENSLART